MMIQTTLTMKIVVTMIKTIIGITTVFLQGNIKEIIILIAELRIKLRNLKKNLNRMMIVIIMAIMLIMVIIIIITIIIIIIIIIIRKICNKC